MWHAIDLTPITALEIYFNWLHRTCWPFMKPLSWFWNIRPVIYRVRAFLKNLPKKNSAILTICDDVSILRFRYKLRSNPKRSGGWDPSSYLNMTDTHAPWTWPTPITPSYHLEHGRHPSPPPITLNMADTPHISLNMADASELPPITLNTYDFRTSTSQLNLNMPASMLCKIKTFIL